MQNKNCNPNGNAILRNPRKMQDTNTRRHFDVTDVYET